MLSCDVLVVGLGHAGMAAAKAACEGGAKVIAIDDNPAPGGQIARAKLGKVENDFEAWGDYLRLKQATQLYSTSIFDLPTSNRALCQGPEGTLSITFKSLILATGSRELFLPFPGWTLPGVMGAGGLQALAKSGLQVKGKRIVVSGSGPLLLPVAQYMAKAGAKVKGPFEQASKVRLAKFGAAALTTKPSEMAKYAGTLLGYRSDTWVVRALGSGKLEGVLLNTGKQLTCDYLACSYGLVPNTELARLAGCEMIGDFVKVDEVQRTSVSNVYAVGEITSIGGHDMASLEGAVAGKVAAGLVPFKYETQTVKQMQRFARALSDAFSPRKELLSLAEEDTIVCRCEDVTLSRLKSQPAFRDAKLQTRCGMGPCQGRICGPAVRELFGWEADSVRPPIIPVPVSALDPISD